MSQIFTNLPQTVLWNIKSPDSRWNSTTVIILMRGCSTYFLIFLATDRANLDTRLTFQEIRERNVCSDCIQLTTFQETILMAFLKWPFFSLLMWIRWHGNVLCIFLFALYVEHSVILISNASWKRFFDFLMFWLTFIYIGAKITLRTFDYFLTTHPPMVTFL